jgi:8-oxo-dGTP pyrophosphatase MutT (NUDIX family)
LTDSNNYPRTQPDGEHLVYETPWWDFYYDDTIRSNGSPGKYSWAKLHSGTGGAMVVPVTPSGRCLMIKVYRYPAKRYMWEFPAGMIEVGETPEEGGRRELLEETGIASDETVLIGSQTPISGFVDEAFYTVLAQIPEIDASDVKT